MYKSHSIAVVVPAYNEERFNGRVIDTMPDFVDTIIVVDDVRQDETASHDWNQFHFTPFSDCRLS